jgi:two-component system NtrC family sensor kinase
VDSLNFEIVHGIGAAQSIGLRDLAERERRLEEAIRETTHVIGWWLAGGLLLLPVAALFVRRRLDAPLADLEHGLARVATGDLNVEVRVRHADELGRLAAHFNETTRILRQRAEEQGRFAAAGQLIADVAHEVNNPLMAIAALSAGRFDDPALPPDAREDWLHVDRQARRAGKLLSSLLRFVRPAPPRVGPVAPNDVVQSAIDLVAYRFPVDEVTLDVRLDPALPPASGDAARLEQVLVNLLTNAIDAMRAVPPPRRLCVESWAEAGRVHVAVADTGPGIPIGIADRVFLPFVTTKGAAGTGLGLYISRQIMREARGDLELASSSGRGARFVAWLPVAPAADGVAPAVRPIAPRVTPVPMSAAPTLAGLRIALVDDEAAVRRPVARFLERRGAEVIEAANGHEGLTRIGPARVDVVIADLRMPVMGGAEFFGRLRQERPELDSRVIFLSGDLRQLEGDGAPQVPPERMLVKPVDLREIERAVLAVAGRAGPDAARAHDADGDGGPDP